MFNNIKEKEQIAGAGSFKLPYFYNLVKITGFEARDSKTGKTQFKLELESKEENKDFKGFERLDGEKAKGKLALVELGIYIDPSDFVAVSNLMTNLSLIANKANVKYDKLNIIFAKAFDVDKEGNATKLKTETLEFLKKVVNAIMVELTKGGYFWIFIKAEEYAKDKFGNYKLNQYNAGTKEDRNYLLWIKSEKCVTKVIFDEKDPAITIGVEGINAVGNNKGDSFTKMREVGNKWELKPFEPMDSNELSANNTDLADTPINEGIDDLPW